VDENQHSIEVVMKTIQMTIEEDLLERVDRMITPLGVPRSAFIRQALERELRLLAIRQKEQQQIEGYKKFPVKKGEFSDWEVEQEWGES
jgi:metal-responsive CopG/Arc/MetJ family transcriptional regulator